MINNTLYCKASGMVMQCIVNFQKSNNRLPYVVEIGSAEGQGIACYAGFCKRVIAIDTMIKHRPDVVSYEKEIFDTDTDKICEFALNTSRDYFDVKLIIGSSHWVETRDKVKDFLQGNQIDILLIDGTHHPTEAVYKDFEHYSACMKRGGYVIFDDTYESDVLEAFEKAASLNSWEICEEWGISITDGPKDMHILQQIKVLRRK